MAECEVVPPTDAPEVPVAQSLFTSVVSELEQHSQMIESWEREKGKEDEEEDPWVFAMPNESVESFFGILPAVVDGEVVDFDGARWAQEDH